jgi:hypothetical protein
MAFEQYQDDCTQRAWRQIGFFARKKSNITADPSGKSIPRPLETTPIGLGCTLPVRGGRCTNKNSAIPSVLFFPDRLRKVCRGTALSRN